MSKFQLCSSVKKHFPHSRVEHGTGQNGGTSRTVRFIRGTGRDRLGVLKIMSRKIVPFFYFSYKIFNERLREPHWYTLQTLGRILKAENSKLWKWLEKMLRILLFPGTKTGPIGEFWLLRDRTGRTTYDEKRQNPVGHGTGRNTAHRYCPVPNPETQRL